MHWYESSFSSVEIGNLISEKNEALMLLVLINDKKRLHTLMTIVTATGKFGKKPQDEFHWHLLGLLPNSVKVSK
jgi:hypothetical protein